MPKDDPDKGTKMTTEDMQFISEQLGKLGKTLSDKIDEVTGKVYEVQLEIAVRTTKIEQRHEDEVKGRKHGDRELREAIERVRKASEDELSAFKKMIEDHPLFRSWAEENSPSYQQNKKMKTWQIIGIVFGSIGGASILLVVLSKLVQILS